MQYLVFRGRGPFAHLKGNAVICSTIDADACDAVKREFNEANSPFWEVLTTTDKLAMSIDEALASMGGPLF